MSKTSSDKPLYRVGFTDLTWWWIGDIALLKYSRIQDWHLVSAKFKQLFLYKNLQRIFTHFHTTLLWMNHISTIFFLWWCFEIALLYADINVWVILLFHFRSPTVCGCVCVCVCLSVCERVCISMYVCLLSINLSSGSLCSLRSPEEQGGDSTRHWFSHSVIVENILNLVTLLRLNPSIIFSKPLRHFKGTHNPYVRRWK